MIYTSLGDQDKQRKLRQVAKTRPAAKAEEGAANPNPNGPQPKESPLQKIAAKLLEGREQAGYTLVPARKAKKNHTVEDTGLRVQRGPAEMALVEIKEQASA